MLLRRLAFEGDGVALAGVRPSQEPQLRSRRSGSSEHRQAEPRAEDLRGLLRAREVARVDRRDVVRLEPLSELRRLPPSVVVQRPVGVALEAARRVPVGLAVANEEQRGHAG